jgi:predicted secreted Zn-dependent protease
MPSENDTQELIDAWNRYIDALAVHESGHVDIVMNNLADLKAQIAASTCETYGDVAQAWLDNVNQASADYDTTTNHGETQGAVFP